MKIIHISDIHFTIPGELMGGLNPHQRLIQALADVNENHSDALRIVITGDLPIGQNVRHTKPCERC